MKVNINEYVKVKLTTKAMDLLYEQYVIKSHPNVQSYCHPVVDKDGYTKLPLWELMHVFGGKMGLGEGEMFEGGMIVFGDDV